MSHFSVLVVTDEEPTEEVLTKVLQPFHEFECTGIDDEYVVEVDVTEEAREEWQTNTARRYRDEAGELHDPYEDRFYREPTAEETKSIGPISGTGSGGGISWHSKHWGDGLGYRPKVHFTPEGFEEIEVPQAELRTFAEFVDYWYERSPLPLGEQPGEDHKYGYVVLDEAGEVVKVVSRTNPNHKWDYWRVGGRYAHRLIVKEGAMSYAAPLSYEWKYDGNEPPEGADSAMVGDLDLEGLKARAVAERKKHVDDCGAEAGIPAADMEQALIQYRECMKVWRDLEERPRGKEWGEWADKQGYPLAAKLQSVWGVPELPEGKSLREWIAAAPPLTAFAALKDGQWYAKGEMGWWAAVHDEKDNWQEEFESMLETLRPDQWVSYVDCHC